MGLIVDKPELLAALSRSDHDIQALREEARHAMQALDDLSGDTTLDGQAWQAVKRQAGATARHRLEAAVRQGDRIMADNDQFRRQLNALIQDDHLDEDGIADCIRRMRQSDNLLRQTQEILPDDGGPLKDTIDGLLQRSQQQAGRLEDKIQRLHTLDQTTRNLYRHTADPDTLQPAAAIDTAADDPNAVMAEFATKDMSDEEMIQIFENRFGMDEGQAKEMADFTDKFREYAQGQNAKAQEALKKDNAQINDLMAKGMTYEQAIASLLGDLYPYLDDQHIAWQYTRLIASAWGPYQGLSWKISANTDPGLLDRTLTAMKYSGPQAKKLKSTINDIGENANKDENKNKPNMVDFVHEMGSMACLLNPNPNNAYAASTIGAPNASPTWGGDVASGGGNTADWHSDMDAINIQQRIKSHPGEDPAKIAAQYQHNLTNAERAREFCANYDPDQSRRDPQQGLEWLRQHGMNRATGSPGEIYLAIKNKADSGRRQDALDSLTNLLQQEINQGK